MPTDEDQIRELVATWMSATKTGDIDKVLELMTDDVVFLVPGKKFGKRQFAEGAKAQAVAGVQFDGRSEMLELTVVGDWAYALTRLRVEMTQPGSPEPDIRAGHTLSIFRKENDTWRLARDANLLAAVSHRT